MWSNFADRQSLDKQTCCDVWC